MKDVRKSLKKHGETNARSGDKRRTNSGEKRIEAEPELAAFSDEPGCRRGIVIRVR